MTSLKEKTDLHRKKILRFPALLLAISLLLLQMASAAPAPNSVITISSPDPDKSYWGVAMQYTRITELKYSGSNNGTLISTFEVGDAGLSKERAGYPIYVSSNGGSTWSHRSTIHEETDPSLNAEWEPFLLELPKKLGNMPTGTLLCAALSVDSAHSRETAIRIYKSSDIGKTWSEISTVATGGALKAGIYEPFLMMLPDGRLVCYYSDETENAKHSQKVVYRVSKDGVNWGSTVNVVALADQKLRPGMPTVTKMNNGQYFMTYEMVTDGNDATGNPVYFRFSTDGLNWGSPTDPGTKLVTDTGSVPGSSPYCIYAGGVGDKGMLVVTACFQTPSVSFGSYLYVNYNYGKGAWQTLAQPLSYRKGGYSHGMALSADGSKLYLVNNVNMSSTSNYCKIAFSYLQLFESKTTAKASASVTSKTTGGAAQGNVSEPSQTTGATSLTNTDESVSAGSSTSDTAASQPGTVPVSVQKGGTNPLVFVAAILMVGILGLGSFVGYKYFKAKGAG